VRLADAAQGVNELRHATQPRGSRSVACVRRGIRSGNAEPTLNYVDGA
jgi:hypothetical protein